MKKIFNSKLLLQTCVASMAAILATVGIVAAATTIGSNINTGGTLTATGATTIYGATSVGGALTATSTLDVSKNITVPTGYGLDTVAAAGTLNIGTTSATTINIGSTVATIAIRGNVTVPSAYGLDANGVLNIGTTTATAINIGSTNRTVNILGPLAVTGTSTMSNNITVPNGYGLDTATAGTLNIGTTTATAINIGKSATLTNFPGYVTMTNASSTNASSTLASFGGGTTVAGLLFGTCTPSFATVIASSTKTAVCGNTNLTGYNVFVTPWITNPQIIFSSASSTASGISISVYNTGATTGDVVTTDHLWSWMAIK